MSSKRILSGWSQANGRWASAWAEEATGRTGQAIVLFALFVTVMIMFAALVTDAGQIWLNRRYLQNAADAAALAGAQQLPNDTSGARAIACDYAANKNGVQGMTIDCEGSDIQILGNNDQIKVTTHKTIVPMIGTMFGWPSIDIAADAMAVLGSLHTVCVFPLYQTQDRLEAAGAWQRDPNGDYIYFNVPMIMKTSDTEGTAGQFLYLSADGNSSSSSAWKRFVGDPTQPCKNKTTGTADPDPGKSVGPLNDGLVSRAQWWNNPGSLGYCPDPFPTFNADGIAVHAPGHPLAGQPLTPENCYRLVQIPLLEGQATDYRGSSDPGPVKGFINFYISNWCGKDSEPPKGSGSDSQHCAPPAGTSLPELKLGELWGYYLKYEAVTNFPIQPYDGLGTKVVLLID
jgi:hypothetical protein